MSTDNALPAERLKAFLLIARGMANFTSGIDLKTVGKSIKSVAHCGTPQFLLCSGGDWACTEALLRTHADPILVIGDERHSPPAFASGRKARFPGWPMTVRPFY